MLRVDEIIAEIIEMKNIFQKTRRLRVRIWIRRVTGAIMRVLRVREKLEF